MYFLKGVQEKHFFYGLVSTHLTPKPQYFVWLHLIRGTLRITKFIPHPTLSGARSRFYVHIRIFRVHKQMCLTAPFIITGNADHLSLCRFTAL